MAMLTETKEDVVKKFTDQVHRMPFFLIQSSCANTAIRDKKKSKKWQQLIADFESGELQKKYPKDDDVKWQKYVTQEMLQEAERWVTDPNGNIAVEYEDEALYCYYILLKMDPENTRFHSLSKIPKADYRDVKSLPKEPPPLRDIDGKAKNKLS